MSTTFGKTGIGLLWSTSLGSGVLIGIKAVLSEDANTLDMQFYLRNASGSAATWKALIYDATGAAGAPGALVFASPEQTLAGSAAAAWVTVTAVVPHLPAGSYYLAYLITDTSSGGFQFAYDLGGESYSRSSLPNTPPDPFGSGSHDTIASDQSVFVDYTPDLPIPVNDTPAAIAGTVAVGKTLTATPGAWTGEDSVAGKWQRASSSGGTYADIGGATSTTYVLQNADLLKYVRYFETATNGFGNTTQPSNILGSIGTSVGSLVAIMGLDVFAQVEIPIDVSGSGARMLMGVGG